MIKDTGGPAFPTYEFVQSHGQMIAVGGMTLRDYFAAKAMQAIYPDGRDYDVTAQLAYEMADTMLKARKQ